MTTFKRAVLTAMVAGLAAGALFVGCAKKPETLKVLYYIDATQAGYDVDQAIWAKFEKDNPGIKIEKEELFNEPFHQKMQAYIAAGTLPDVFYMWPSGRSQIIHDKKLAKDLNVLLGKDYLANFSAAAQNPANQGGGYIAEIPQSFTYTTTVYVNKKLLADNGFAVPTTYAEMKAMVPKLKAKGIETLFLPNKDKWPAQSCLFSTIAGRMAGDKFIDSVKAGQAKFTDKPFVDALAFVQTMYKDGVVAKNDATIGYGEGPGIFAANKVAMFVDGDWRVSAYITDKASGKALIAPALQTSDFELVNFPAIPGEQNPGTVSAIAGVGFGIASTIPAGSAKEKAAVKLMKYLYSNEVQTIKYEQGAYIPTLKGVKSDKVEPLTTKLVGYYGTIPSTCYVLDGVLDPSVCNILNDGLQMLLAGTGNPTKIATDMQKAMDAWIAAKK
jgi:raffinose/stachyose/melibiose transport system substrate-binding protein